ncbi:MAG: hypothetical protein LBC12_01600 [Nitrososphaerota archaeon]|nr:hypothetical protein [Nitrososphaerota archaeon]
MGKNDRADYVGTSCLVLIKGQVKLYFERLWGIGVMHGELKRICGFGRCQVNIGRVGRNHVGLFFVALV